MKVILYANTDWYLYNFRLALIRKLRVRGFEVVLVSPPGPYGERFAAEGARWIALPMLRRSINPMREVGLLRHLVKLYRDERPDLVHHFTVKCVVYGSLAALLAGVPCRVNAVAGMGYVYANNNFRTRVLRTLLQGLMRVALRGKQSRLILQNPVDCAAFQDAGLIDSDRVRLIPSSGVNTDRFRPRAKEAGHSDGTVRVLLAARLLWEKGIGEYIEAARRLKAEGLAVTFLLAGTPDPGNPGSATEEDVSAWQREGVVNVLGHVEDMAKQFENVDIVVLPSYYREGVPRSLIEAAASGLPIITTDEPGCRDVVSHGVNGSLVTRRDVDSLTAAMRFLVERSDERTRMGMNGRLRALEEFDEKIVLSKTLGVYAELAPEQFRGYFDDGGMSESKGRGDLVEVGQGAT